jgi:hypothetical protein
MMASFQETQQIKKFRVTWFKLQQPYEGTLQFILAYFCHNQPSKPKA